MSDTEHKWWSLPTVEVATALECPLETGLTEDEAARRLLRDGPNQLGEKPPPPAWLRFLRQFADITVLALIGAALIATFVASLGGNATSTIEKFRDAIAIGLIVVINAFIGFFQEQKAERALSALRGMSAPLAKVLRARSAREVAAKDLVSGDVVVLAEGDRVPADLRLAEAHDLAADESALTGESVAVDKQTGELSQATPLAERSNMLFLGTHVVRGRGLGLVVATAGNTELGKIAQLLEDVQRPLTPLQERLKKFGLVVVLGCILVGVLVFAVGLVQRHADTSVLLLTAVSLAVAVIPEGLPAITTIVLALGVERMAKKRALIRRLPAVESLGAATVICTDKTGTLTQNRMRVRRLWCAGNQFPVEDAQSLRRATEAEGSSELTARLLEVTAYAPAQEDPTDLALLSLFNDTRSAFELPEGAPSALTMPFDNQRRIASVIVERDDYWECFTHGAPEAILQRATEQMTVAGARTLDEQSIAAIQQAVEDLASGGLRVLGLATGVVPKTSAALPERSVFERNLRFSGLLGLADPPRPEVEAALLVAKQAGIRTIMITGDHPATARAIAGELGILDGGRVLSGSEVEQLPRPELGAAMREVRVVARATAQHKLALVEALRDDGEVVAMTGDGVNDAPAIKAADIGVAMGRHSTDVTREAAGMVIYDGSYSTIVDAIAEGRITYQNIKRFILFLFTVNLSLVIAVFVASIVGIPPVLTPTQILWINLITNGLPALALGMEPGHEDPMRRSPRDPLESIVRPNELVPMIGYGATMGAMGLGAFFVFRGESVHLARTAAFTVLAIGPLFHAINSRSRWDSVFQLGLLSNWRLLGAFLVALGLQAIAVYMPGARLVFDTEPLPFSNALALLGVSAMVWVLGEIHKWLHRTLSVKKGSSGRMAQTHT